MPFCSFCGAKILTDAHFCHSCGKIIPIIQKQQTEPPRKIFTDGKVQRCLRCGAILSSFELKCSKCGYELLRTKCNESLKAFEQKYTLAETNSKKIDLIRTYIIPNTKEDILEFAILASSNIDLSINKQGTEFSSNDYSLLLVKEAWLAKLDQAYQKAYFLMEESPEFQKIKLLFFQRKKQMRVERIKAFLSHNKKTLFFAFIAISILIFLALIIPKIIDNTLLSLVLCIFILPSLCYLGYFLIIILMVIFLPKK